MTLKTIQLMEVKNVSKTYMEGKNPVHALNNTSLNIKKGEMIAIMGPSGSGKSTLLSILGVLNTPTNGTVSTGGTIVYDLTPAKQSDFRFQNLGFIFQSLQLIPYLTAIENVMLPLTISGLSGEEQEKNALSVLTKVGLENKTNRLPNQLSGGEQQRVAIARAIVNKPPILLADEPTGNLDSKTSEEILSLLKKLNQEGQTIVMVTHDEKIAGHAHRIIHLKDGKIEKEVNHA